MRQALQMALDFVEFHSKYWDGIGSHPAVIAESIREALKQDPVAWTFQRPGISKIRYFKPTGESAQYWIPLYKGTP